MNLSWAEQAVLWNRLLKVLDFALQKRMVGSLRNTSRVHDQGPIAGLELTIVWYTGSGKRMLRS